MTEKPTETKNRSINYELYSKKISLYIQYESINFYLYSVFYRTLCHHSGHNHPITMVFLWSFIAARFRSNLSRVCESTRRGLNPFFCVKTTSLSQLTPPCGVTKILQIMGCCLSVHKKRHNTKSVYRPCVCVRTLNLYV